MLKSYLKSAWRRLVRNKMSSLVNIGGLSVAMAVAILIGLWIWDELSWNTGHQNYDRIAQVMRHSSFNGTVTTQSSMAVPLRTELGERFAADFKHIILSTPADQHLLMLQDKKLLPTGRFMEAGAPDMLSLQMVHGAGTALNDPASILLSASLAKQLFGAADPMDHIIRLDAKMELKVAGVYRDVPANSQFSDLAFIAPWSGYAAQNDWARKAQHSWSIHSYDLFVQLQPGVNLDQVSAKIRDIERNHLGKAIAEARNPQTFLYPMAKWHLYGEWKDGINTGGRIQFVWLFGAICVFVLLLACINFTNLSTAQAAKRAKEVGVRKVIGSAREQLIAQFFGESLLTAACAFICALLLAAISLPFFNELAGKKMQLLWGSPVFWMLGLGFSLLTGLLAGLYPALYLSSFRPARVLKGVFLVGKYTLAPRKILVITQFTVSVILIIGTLVVYRQIQFARDRPVGYDRNGLIAVHIKAATLLDHYDALRAELLKTGAVADMAASQGPTTGIWDERSGFEWPGKDPDLQADFATIAITHDYAKTLGLQFSAGRDFSRQFPTDMSNGVLLNEAAVKLMGLQQPVEQQTITWGGERLHVVGVVKDMVMTSPYEPVKQTVYYLNYGQVNHLIIRIQPGLSAQAALDRIAPVFLRYNPADAFDYRFVNQEYALKFAAEERIGKLAACFASLAIFVSCLGLFGLVTFITRQRAKEMGIRKVMGASVANLWALLSKEFVWLVLIASLLAAPAAYYLMASWLAHYTYRTSINWWIFAAGGLSAMVIALFTVSYQSLKTALANPVRSLRSE